MTTPGVSHPSPTTVEDFRRVLDERAVQPVFQPLVDLDNRHVLGDEALARGPMGSALESPAALFGAAYRAGRVAELDWACRAAAFTKAVRGGLGPPRTLFVNKVKRGDTLSGIAAKKLGEANRWPEIARLNRDIVPDPDEIVPGQVLVILKR